MATARGGVYIRDVADISVNALVETANKISELIIESGMIQVANDEYTGQSKIYSATAGAGFTQVTKDVSSFGIKTIGYKVYRHPSLKLYIKVVDMYIVQASGPHTFARFEYQMSCGLNGMGDFDNAKKTSMLVPLNMLAGSPAIATQPSDFLKETTTISCGADHFWISRDAGVKSWTGSSTALLPSKIDPLGIAVIASQSDSDVLCLILPQEISTSVSQGLLGVSLVNSAEKSCVRYSVYSNGFWSNLKNGAAGSLSQAVVSSTDNGIRVTQAELVVNGVYHRFNFGFVASLALAQSDNVEINLTGVIGKYQAVPNMGFADHAPPLSTPSENSSILLPIVN